MSGRPHTAEQWRVYLAGYSADFLRAADADRLDELGDDRRASGWLGFAGADQDALTAVEQRLGTALPPGYRAFLEASDGWLEMGPFVWTMRTTADVGWLRDIEPGLCEEDDELMARALLVSGDAGALLARSGGRQRRRGMGGVRLGIVVSGSGRPSTHRSPIWSRPSGSRSRGSTPERGGRSIRPVRRSSSPKRP